MKESYEESRKLSLEKHRKLEENEEEMAKSEASWRKRNLCENNHHGNENVA